ncbi:MAG: sulfite exporter TauE/SafE family protein, partial [Bdellovibrionales bacterium]|nr:sulfite exporter TauE/SafE family protein [Bdellovibrionales bacterium]
TIVPIHGVVQLASNSTRALSLISHVEKRILIPTVITLPLGVFISTQLIKSISNREVFYFLIAALIFYVLFKPKKMPKLMIPFWAFSILGLIAGILTPIIGAIGPMLAPFFLRDDLSKEQIVATKASVQLVGHFLKIPAFLYLGFDYGQYGLLITCMVIGVIIGTQVGVKILKRINEKSFRLIFRSALLIAAVRILYKAIHSLGYL